jgi:hypothetical protein
MYQKRWQVPKSLGVSLPRVGLSRHGDTQGWSDSDNQTPDRRSRRASPNIMTSCKKNYPQNTNKCAGEILGWFKRRHEIFSVNKPLVKSHHEIWEALVRITVSPTDPKRMKKSDHSRRICKVETRKPHLVEICKSIINILFILSEKLIIK